MFVICESKKCKKTPCIASIDDGINIDKFDECFYSTVKAKWRKATTEEYICIRCARCRKENKVLSQLQQQNVELMEVLTPFAGGVVIPDKNDYDKAKEVYNKYRKS